MLQKLRNNKAFTVIELMVVVVILFILGVVALGSFKGYQENLEKKESTAVEQTQPEKVENKKL